MINLIYKQGHKGALALGWGATIGLLAVLGGGLLVASLLMSMALLIGAIWASLVLGVVFLGLAAILIAQRKEQSPPPPLPPAPPLDEIVFTLGFVAARALLRDRR